MPFLQRTIAYPALHAVALCGGALVARSTRRSFFSMTRFNANGLREALIFSRAAMR
jgi:hypothetical protein